MCFLCLREDSRKQYLPLETLPLETLLVNHLGTTLILQVNHQATTLRLQVNHQATLKLHLNPSRIEKGGSLTYTGGWHR
jgi:hypothetical protein